MATIIDALVMTLGLDTRNFDKGRKDSTEGLDKFKKQADSVAKDVANGGKRMAEGFVAIRNEIIGLLAVVTAGRGLKNFLTDGVTGMAALGRLSTNLSMSARELDSWGAAAESVGGSAEGMQQSLQALAGGIEEFKLTGQSPMMSVLRSLGVNATDQGKVRAYGDILLDLADRFKGMSAQDSLAFGKRLGFDDSTIYLLRQGRDAVAQLRAEMEKNSGVTQNSVENAQRIQAMWAKVSRQAKGLGDSIFTALEPAITLLVGRLSRWIDKNQDLIRTKAVEWVERFVNWLPKFVDQMGKLIDKVGDIVELFGGWKSVGIGLGLVLTINILKPVLSIVAGLARMIPMLSSAAAGMGLLATAAAGAAGYAVGSAINDKVFSGTKAGDWVGRQVATAMSLLGSDTAKQAVIQEHWASLTTEQRQAKRKEIGEHKASKPLPSRGANYDSQHSRRFASNEELFSLLEERAGLPKGILAQMFKTESGGGKNLLSPAGARGPFQFMPDTAKELGLDENSVMDLDASAAAASRYLAQLRDKFGGDLTKAVASYNWGSGNVSRKGIDAAPEETQNYIKAFSPYLGASARTSGSGSQRSVSSTSETNIKEINIHTAATDAKGIAATIGPAISRTGLVAQANTGMG